MGTRTKGTCPHGHLHPSRPPDPAHSGLIAALAAFGRHPAGPLFEPLVVEDTADSWGTGRGSYRKIAGRFRPAGRPFVVESGPVRTITRSVLLFGASRVVMDVVSYPSWPVLEFRFRVTWNEERRRLKLRVPTALVAASLFVEVPGGAIDRPSDGEEHVHGRWLVVEGRQAPRRESARTGRPAASGGDALAIGIASCGQHGFDMKNGELRLSVLRSSAYCHEQGFDLDPNPGTRTSGICPLWKFADIGVHEFRLLVTAGAPASVRAMMPGLADHLAAPPAAYVHLPYDAEITSSKETLLALKPASVRLLACKRSWDGKALIVRLQEAVGKKTKAELDISLPDAQVPGQPEKRGHVPKVHVPNIAPRSGLPGKAVLLASVPLSLAPFEIKTLRIEKRRDLAGSWR